MATPDISSPSHYTQCTPALTLAAMPFTAASAYWLEQHSRYVKASTTKNYAGALKVLRPFFGDIPLQDITIAHIRDYQDERRKKAGAYLLNGEVGVVQQILKEARLWKNLEEDYRPLPVPRRGAGTSLDKEDEERLRKIAFSKPKWRLAAHCMMVMLSTTMGFGELRQLRRRDVDMTQRSVLVREGAKNNYRNRTIPLNATAFASMTWILDRWKQLGGFSEEHYILPHRPRSLKGGWVMDEPMTAIQTAFRAIREAAGIPKFRIYDCRVQAITRLLSNPMVSSQVSKEIAGHISEAMQARYSIQRFNTKKAALDALEDSTHKEESLTQVMPEAAKQPPPTPPVIDVMQPAIQAEIARQVALALQNVRQEPSLERRSNAPRLISFPGGAR